MASYDKDNSITANMDQNDVFALEIRPGVDELVKLEPEQTLLITLATVCMIFL